MTACVCPFNLSSAKDALLLSRICVEDETGLGYRQTALFFPEDQENDSIK